MTIEMSAPEELFPDLECVQIAKKVTVPEARPILKEKLKNDEPIAVKDIERVNTPFRRELMKQKTNELMGFVVGSGADPENADLHLMLDMFDYLAIDWVFSNEMHWNGSLADSYAKKIRDYVGIK